MRASSSSPPSPSGVSAEAAVAGASSGGPGASSNSSTSTSVGASAFEGFAAGEAATGAGAGLGSGREGLRARDTVTPSKSALTHCHISKRVRGLTASLLRAGELSLMDGESGVRRHVNGQLAQASSQTQYAAFCAVLDCSPREPTGSNDKFVAIQSSGVSGATSTSDSCICTASRSMAVRVGACVD